MKRTKMLMMLLAVILILGGAGCEEQFTPEQIQQLAAQQETLQQQVDELQEQAQDLAESAIESGVIDPNIGTQIHKINTEIDKVQSQIFLIAQALEGVELTGDQQQDLIALLQAANTASSSFNPYAAPISAGLTLLSAILAWLAKYNANKAKKATAKYQAHKQGVEKTMKEVSASKDESVKAVETQLYKNIGNARSALGIT